MNNLNGNINFSFEYAISLIVVLIVCNILVKSNPQMNTIIVIIIGLFIGFITLYFINHLFPTINKTVSNITQYYEYEWMNNFNSMGYIHVWPPILIILIVFIILLYNRQLG